MPINELIRDRKITPDQLAFPNSLDGGGKGRSTSYQQNLKQYAVNETTNITINEATDLVRGEVRQRANAERRAKSHVATWHNAWRYELDGESFDVYHRDYTLLPYDKANIENDGYNNHLGAFGFVATAQTRGVYWVYAHLTVALVVPPEVIITYVRLALFKNNALHCIIDHADTGMTDGKDWVLRGGDMIHVDEGDIVSFAVYPEINALEYQNVLIPTGAYGYCCGARMICDPTGTAPLNNGESYIFTT